MASRRKDSSASDEDTPLLLGAPSSTSMPTVSAMGKGQPFPIEPIVTLLSFGLSVSGVVLANTIVYQTCVVTLGYNRTVCLLLGTNSNLTEVMDLETIVQPYAAVIGMVSTVLTSVLPAICALFMGPWSDKFGRKPAMIVPCIGYKITFITITILSVLSKYYLVDPWCYVVAHIPASILGGPTVLFAAIYSYLTDVTTEKERTVRIGILQACSMLGVFIGLLSSSYILKWTNVPSVFFIAGTAMAISSIILACCIEESVNVQTATLDRRVREIFRINHLRDLVKTFFKKRSSYDRLIVWLTIAIGSVTVLATGGGTVFFLYTRKAFSWTVKEYTMWQSVELLSTVAGNFIGITVLKKLFHVPDIWLALLSVISYSGDTLIKGLARHGWQLYLATGITPLKATEGPALMSICSALIPSAEIAKFYSIAMAITNMSAIAAAPLFTYIYSATLTTAPEIFNFVASGIFLINVILVGIIAVLMRMRRANRFDPLAQTDDETMT